ncbi:hypothetical protein [Pontiella sulfatireligans]|uniref:Glycoside hydrolase family 42 N-terminal domain-containing protein n=1 Tax=Pontiella sulfatireligans TaxID=2750658 RepID=A0A6C2UUS9_9BACT|nr:hypothetical protein [Pontiella sulfatireligans]VGO22887.1 hypothetical protein SCARR_04984 [Pontiella sulfatireligans]
MNHIRLKTACLLALVLFAGMHIHAASIIYDFEVGSYVGIAVENATLSAADGELKMSIAEEQQSWKARLLFDINQDIFELPRMFFRYRIGHVEPDKVAGCAVTITIDGLTTSNGDLGTWRIYPGLNASTDAWQNIEIDLAPLVESWELTHGQQHGNIETINFYIGNAGDPYFGDLWFEYIKIGDVLAVNDVQVNPFNQQELLVNLSKPVTGTAMASNFTVLVDGIMNPVMQTSLSNSTVVVLRLDSAIEIPREVTDVPDMSLSYNGNDSLVAEGDDLLEAFDLMVLTSAYAENLWKYWGTFNKVTQPYPAVWITNNTVVNGWDWSLPESVAADPNAYFKFAGDDIHELSCGSLRDLHVTWDELEPTEGVYDFESLRQQILDAAEGYDGVSLRLRAALWETVSPTGLPLSGMQLRENAPRWMDSLDIAKINMHTDRTDYQVHNLDIMDPDYHSRYQLLIEALGNSGIPAMEELKVVNLCYRSASYGEEFTVYDQDDFDQLGFEYTADEIASRTKERLDFWADAFGTNVWKLMYVGSGLQSHVDYAGQLGIGSRNGFIEMYGATIHMPQFGITINSDRHVDVDETNPFIANNLRFGDENEEYSNEERFGWKESFPYRYQISSFRMLQMRRNYVMHDNNTLNPELTWYLGLGLSRNVENTPDAWVMLNELSISPWANKNEDGSSNAGPVKNVERWLYQRDISGYETTPCMAVPTAKDLWYADNGRPYDYTARKGQKMGFVVDDRLLLMGEHPVVIKVSYYDGVPGTLKLVYTTSSGTQEKSVVATGEDKVKTVTFFIDAVMDAPDLNFDFELHSVEEVPVFFVRLIKQETDPKTCEFVNTTGDGRWTNAANWDVGTVPATVDAVHHTSVAGSLEVDAESYAYILNISHDAMATVAVSPGGHLMVKNDVKLGTFGNSIGRLLLNNGAATIGNFFFVGDSSHGELEINGGNLNLSLSAWNPLRIGTGEGDGTVNLNGGTILTPGVEMDWSDTDAGSSTLNLNSGLLQIEGSFSAALRMDDDAVMNIDQGVLRWRGDRIADFTTLVTNNYVNWSNGQTNMLTEDWEQSWTNGNSILFADFNDVSNGYTTVWATRTSGYAAWSNQYGLVFGPDGDDDNDQFSNFVEYGLGGDPTNPAHQGHRPTFEKGSDGFNYVHAVRSDPNSGLLYYLELTDNLVSNVWKNEGYTVIGTNIVDGDFNFVSNRIFTAGTTNQFIRLIIEEN